MAKAVFHKHQRVYVEPVGTWAIVEQIKPHWVKGVEEPVRIAYDVGLGRDFTADELIGDKQVDPLGVSRAEAENWRVLRGANRWQKPEECSGHPFPGTYPIVVTDAKNWGGWRVPGGEYDRDPHRIEFQARAIASTLRLLQVADMLASFARRDSGDLPHELIDVAEESREILRYVRDEAQDAPVAAA
ncbi:MAG: hypothetical protein MI723_07690 [Caulobacterales bacterium]|nr:hypothetical protein [Caulobacterales bacterium]